MGPFACCRSSSSFTARTGTAFAAGEVLQEDQHHAGRCQAVTPNLRVFTYEELSSATSGFSPSTLLGRGSHGSVFLASLDSGRLLAAAKLPSPSDLSDRGRTTTTATDAEIDLLSSLPRSPLLVNLVGATPAGGPAPRIAVVDLMARGSLYDVLHHPVERPPPFRRRLRLAFRAAAALAHLHALGVVHRDVKPSNLLLDSKGLPRLADFGLAVRLPGGAEPKFPAPAGTMGYIDPGYVRPEDVSEKTDVYSFGVVLLEVLSGRRGIDMEYSPPGLVDWAAPLIAAGRFDDLWDQRSTPSGRRQEKAAREVAGVAARCVAAEPEDRPTMLEVVDVLRTAERTAGRGRTRLAVARCAAALARGKRSSFEASSASRNGRVSDVASS